MCPLCLNKGAPGPRAPPDTQGLRTGRPQSRILLVALLLALILVVAGTLSWLFLAPPGDSSGEAANEGGTLAIDAGPDLLGREEKRVGLPLRVLWHAGPVRFNWTQVSGPAVRIDSWASWDAGFPVPAGTAGETLVFEVRARDGTSVATDQVRVTVVDSGHPNIGPHAFAMLASQSANAVAGVNATILGDMSWDPDGDRLTTRWERVSGPAVEFADPTDDYTTVRALEAGIVVLRLTVSDGVLEDSDTLEIHFA
jgi:hypothetical protein